MPELAEVEVCRKSVHERCLNLIIKKVTIVEDELVFGKDGYQKIKSHLTSNKIIDTGRYGKCFYWILAKGPHLVGHLGMTGNIKFDDGSHIYLSQHNASKEHLDWPPRFSKLELEFEDSKYNATKMSLTDARRLARVKLVDDPLNCEPISKLGFDAYLNPPNLSEFSRLVIKRQLPIKALLLDQKFSAGLGNWLVDEILYQSKVHPSQVTNTLNDDQLEAIHKNMINVCKTAVAVNADHKKFPKDWIFLHRWGKGKKNSIPMVNNQKIEFITVGGRTSAVVPSVQKLLKTKKLDVGENKLEIKRVKKQPKVKNGITKASVKSEEKDLGPKAEVSPKKFSVTQVKLRRSARLASKLN